MVSGVGLLEAVKDRSSEHCDLYGDLLLLGKRLFQHELLVQVARFHGHEVIEHGDIVRGGKVHVALTDRKLRERGRLEENHETVRARRHVQLAGNVASFDPGRGQFALLNCQFNGESTEQILEFVGAMQVFFVTGRCLLELAGDSAAQVGRGLEVGRCYLVGTGLGIHGQSQPDDQENRNCEFPQGNSTTGPSTALLRYNVTRPSV